MVVFGDYLILILYDQRYHAAAGMLPILSLGIWPLLLSTTGAPCLLALGRPLYAAVGNCLKLIYMIGIVPLSFQAFGILGTVTAVAFNDLAVYMSTSYGLGREQLSLLKQDFVVTVFLLMLLAISLQIRYMLGFGWPMQTLL